MSSGKTHNRKSKSYIDAPAHKTLISVNFIPLNYHSQS